jgi:hypothetical protein
MASVFYNEAKRAFAAGEFDWGADDFRARLLMNTTTADTENDGLVNIADITTVDKADSTGYADVAFANEAVTKEDANDWAKLVSDSVVFSGLGGDATRDYQGILIYKYVDGTDANDLVCCYCDFTAQITLAATQVTVPVPTNGWAYMN